MLFVPVTDGLVILLLINEDEQFRLLKTFLLVASNSNTAFDETLNWNLLLLKSASKFYISEFWTNIEEYDIGEGKDW